MFTPAPVYPAAHAAGTLALSKYHCCELYRGSVIVEDTEGDIKGRRVTARGRNFMAVKVG